MKLKISIAVISILFFNLTNAQVSYGIRAGLNIANWRGESLQGLNNIVDLSKGFINTKSRTGIHIGGYLDIPVTENVSFEPGLQYSQKGYALRGDLAIDVLKYFGINAKAQVQSSYIDMPLLLKANVSNGFTVYGGPQLSFLLHERLHLGASVLGISVYNKNWDMTDNFNKVDVAIAGGVGYKFENGFNINAGYDYGFGKLDKNNNYKAYNRAVKISLGFTL